MATPRTTRNLKKFRTLHVSAFEEEPKFLRFCVPCATIELSVIVGMNDSVIVGTNLMKNDELSVIVGTMRLER
ncbi:hypothetical protein TSUD_219960 [Trifolium subterraneum]|uniref:Uncharacterized protein n=1 Tax=Trifolium subterraneum TaxID=3900 RepID=A0A2Z6NCF9_TRISU|nr:hypothetical protein TSUD_219960 [Trifolium subterraneum]